MQARRPPPALWMPTPTLVPTAAPSTAVTTTGSVTATATLTATAALTDTGATTATASVAEVLATPVAPPTPAPQPTPVITTDTLYNEGLTNIGNNLTQAAGMSMDDYRVVARARLLREKLSEIVSTDLVTPATRNKFTLATACA